MYNKLLAVGILGLVCHMIGLAQFVVPTQPLLTRSNELRSLFNPTASDTIHLPAVIQGQERDQSEFRTITIGKVANILYNEDVLGRWSYSSQAQQYIWHCTFISPNASSLSLRLDDYHLPLGARLFLRSEDGRIRGAYTEAHNNDVRILQFAPLEGRMFTLIYEAPRGAKPTKRPFRIGAISQGYPQEFNRWKTLDRDHYGFTNGEPFYDHMQSTLSSLRCAPNIVGFSEYSNLGRSVVLMITEGNTLSTGVLINNTKQDATAYILTSAHCINRLYDLQDLDAIKNVVRSSVFFFGFESPSADLDIRGNQELTLSGAELIAYEPDADMALLKITGLPQDDQGQRYIPKIYRPYYAGWNLNTSPSAPYIGIHHPVGSTKRMSLSEEQIEITDYSIMSRGIDWENKHWYLSKWSIGTTAAGSSGSPLFDADGHIIGALSGGRSTCTSPVSDYYWALRQTWSGPSDTQSLSPWLDPDNSGTRQLAGYDPYASQSIQRLSPLYAKHGIKYASPTLHSGRSGLGRNIHISSTSKPLGMYIVFYGDTTLQSKFPSLTIDLHSISGNQVQASIWSTQIDSAPFDRYNSTTIGFEKGIRTLGYGIIELFVPMTNISSVPAGNYLLSVRTTDGSDLSLKILSEPYRLTRYDQVEESWYLSTAGWSPQVKPPFQSYWIDLLVESAEPLSTEPNKSQSNQFVTYYHQGILYVLNPLNELAYLNVYTLDGRLVQRDVQIVHGESQIELRYTPSFYIAHIRGPLGERVLKIRSHD